MILTMHISIQDDGTPTGSHISEFITTGETWEEYLQRMSEDGQWATEVELVALSNALGAAVLVTNDCDHDEQFQHWIYPPELMTHDVILLGYSHSTQHYYSLQSKHPHTIIIILYYTTAACTS